MIYVIDYSKKFVKKRKIILSFNRDFNQWINELVRDQHVFNFPKVIGVGLSDQITHFDGRTFEWWRYEDEMAKFKNYIIHLPPGSPVFSVAAVKNFLKIVKQLKKLAIIKASAIKSPVVHLQKLEALFNEAYPWYPLSIFISGPWREDIIEIHGKKASALVRRFSASRRLSEGLPNIVGDHLRKWLGHYLEEVGLPGDWVKLLSVKEARDLVSHEKLPKPKVLCVRSNGYVYFGAHIYPEKRFFKFLAQHKLKAVLPLVEKGVKSLQGMATWTSKEKIIGKAKIVFNTVEAVNFPKGAILVTPMTIPTFLVAVHRAKAIITDEGGLLCHAAIISRELKIPCVIGTKIATQVFKDGDMVEVDANKGIVRKI